MLSNLVEGDVLFIDEIHRIARPAEEMLYLAMEDFRVDVVVGKGPGATSIPLEVAPFTLVGATTRSGALTGPLRDRFGFTAHMDFYEPRELEQVLFRSAGILGIEVGDDAGAEIARRSRGTPRIANRLLRRVRDYAEVRADGVITRDVAKAALAVYDVDELGLDRLDRAVLSALTRSFGGGPVGVSTLAVAVGEEAATVEEVCEPFLVRAGMIARTPRGRVATALAWTHLGMTPPPGAGGLGTDRTLRMITAALLFASLAALVHVYIFVLESVTWTIAAQPKGIRHHGGGGADHQDAGVQSGLLQPVPGHRHRGQESSRSCSGTEASVPHWFSPASVPCWRPPWCCSPHRPTRPAPRSPRAHSRWSRSCCWRSLCSERGSYETVRMSFLLTNSSMPNRPSSRPKPERFIPPNGNSTPSAPTPLMKTIPASILSAIRLACSESVVNTYEPRPNGVSLAICTASSSESTLYTVATGPNSSSR